MRYTTGYLWRLGLAGFMISGTGITAFAQFTYDRQEGAKPKGKIDTIITTTYEYRNDDTTRHFKEKNVNVYNAKGQLTVAYLYFYPQSFNVRLGDKEPTPANAEYNYDDRGNVSEVRYYIRAPMLWYKSTYAYSSPTKLVKVRHDVNRDNKMISDNYRSLFTDTKLDNSGKMIEEVEYSDTSKIDFKRNFKYNSQGYLIEQNSFPNYSEQTWASVRMLLEYDRKGNLSKRSYFTIRNDVILHSFAYTYTYTKFDRKGNWLVQKEYASDKLHTVIERRITYK
jgi:hypothetical protein